jgi:hypothetical protein
VPSLETTKIIGVDMGGTPWCSWPYTTKDVYRPEFGRSFNFQNNNSDDDDSDAHNICILDWSMKHNWKVLFQCIFVALCLRIDTILQLQ